MKPTFANVMKMLAIMPVLLSLTSRTSAQTKPVGDSKISEPLRLEAFRPRAMLKVAVNERTKGRFPVVDVHGHFSMKFHGSQQKLDDYVAMMDRTGVALSVNLDGELGDKWQDHAAFVWKKHRDRFLLFVHLDWRGDGKPNKPETWDCQRPDFARRIARQLKEAKAKGCSGVKFFKMFGLKYQDADGSFLKIDDRRWDPIWQACGELGLPVIIHTADPIAFFQPIDEKNERYEELYRHPNWSFADEKFPTHDELLAARNRVIERHPGTRFIGAHVANCSEDLATVSQWLDKYPNLVVEIASRIGELGRQPFTSRKFMIKYADRIMFGTDGPKPERRMQLYFRFLETEDEYFPYSEKAFPPQGFWNIYGVNLPDDVLRKIYYENAARYIPGVKEKLIKAGVSVSAN
ncbi:MAG: amidohydrolase family protein [Planctomycetota bacterium]